MSSVRKLTAMIKMMTLESRGVHDDDFDDIQRVKNTQAGNTDIRGQKYKYTNVY